MNIETIPVKNWVNVGDCMALKLCFSLDTVLAANFGCYKFRMIPEMPSESQADLTNKL